MTSPRFLLTRRARALRLSILIAVALIFALAAPTIPPAHAQDGCDGLLPPRLSLGQPVRISSTYGLSLKNQPMTGASGAVEITQISYGMLATVTDGYRCNDGYTWWQLILPDGTTGWAAEGDAFNYFLEPAAVELHSFRPDPTWSQIAHDIVTPDGRATRQGVIPLAAVSGTAGELWQPVEFEYAIPALERLRATCPDRLTSTHWDTITTPETLQALPVTTREIAAHPAPTGDAIVLVRDLTVDLPRCATVLPERVGIARVSLVTLDGTERELFPYAQHSSIPAAEDRYTLTDPTVPNIWLDEIVWSPNGQYVAFVAGYRDACEGASCASFQLYVWSVPTGQLFILGEGRHIGWQNGGERINFFRLTGPYGSPQVAQLYSARPDGTDRQDIYLPGGAEYVSSTHALTGYPWNISGTRVMVANKGGGEVMLYDLNDLDFTTPVVLPDLMPAPNRLAVDLMRGDTAFLWATIRGDFVLQDVQRGNWQQLQSQVATTGIAPRDVRPFPDGTHALITLADGSAYALDLNADTLLPIVFPN